MRVRDGAAGRRRPAPPPPPPTSPSGSLRRRLRACARRLRAGLLRGALRRATAVLVALPGGLLRLGRRSLPVVGGVEPRALEDQPDGREDPARRPATHGAWAGRPTAVVM